MRLSCPEQMLSEYSVEARISIIRECGFDGVDCRFETLANPDFSRSLAESGLPLASVYSQVRTPSLLDKSAADRAEAIGEIIRRARIAAKFGAENMILVPIFGEPRLTVNASHDRVTELETSLLIVSLNEIAGQLRNTPITTIIEPLNRDETHFLTDPRIAAKICDQVNAPNIATMVDTYHCYQEHLDIPQQIRSVGTYMRLVHFSDSERGLPGEGEVDFEAVSRALDDADYLGWIGFECRQITNEQDERALAHSVARMRSLARIS